MTDIALRRRRLRPEDGFFGCECWLLGVYPIASDTPILTICNRPLHLGGDISYGGDSYTYYNWQIEEPPDTDSRYALPEATIRICNILRALITSLRANDFYRGYRVRMIPYNTAEPSVDYTADTKELVWVNHAMDGSDLLVTVGVPGELTRIVPNDLYSSGTCGHCFRLAAGVYGCRCGYTAKTIAAVNHEGPGRVWINVVNHGFVTGNLVELSGITGITPSLNTVFTVEKFNDNVFKLDGTDADDYSGTWGADGVAGHYICEQHRAACIARGRLANFSALPGLDTDVLRVGV